MAPLLILSAQCRHGGVFHTLITCSQNYIYASKNDNLL